ncbi:uncharacterized protein LOC135480438 [Liolophura sinensis]|uniref:uncharacterized protein LOC135480438 n=1 Tax=Liolophura sinensis TaxID=3198878 RepID=UPI003158C990
MARAPLLNRCGKSVLAVGKDLLGTRELSGIDGGWKRFTFASTSTNSGIAIISCRPFSWWRTITVTSARHTTNHMTRTQALPVSKSPRLLLGPTRYNKAHSVSSWMSVFERPFSSDSGSDRGRSELADDPEDSRAAERPLGPIEGRLAIGFTCKICQTRCTKTFSKLSYKKGVVIVRCDGCGSNHLIADNLGWFSDVQGRNVEEILASKGETVKKLSVEGLLDVSLGDRDLKDGD